LVRAGEIEVTGEDIETVGDYFTLGFEFPGGRNRRAKPSANSTSDDP
jgi:hypothetical protein